MFILMWVICVRAQGTVQSRGAALFTATAADSSRTLIPNSLYKPPILLNHITLAGSLQLYLLHRDTVSDVNCCYKFR